MSQENTKRFVCPICEKNPPPPGLMIWRWTFRSELERHIMRYHVKTTDKNDPAVVAIINQVKLPGPPVPAVAAATPVAAPTATAAAPATPSAVQATTAQPTPADMSPDLYKVWLALGKPNVSKHNSVWMGCATVSPTMVPGLKPFLRSRDGNQEHKKFSKKIVRDHSNSMSRDEWINDSDPLIWSVSGWQLQGNQRLLGLEDSGKTISFTIILGVEDRAERYLGHVYSWLRYQLLGEPKQLVQIATNGVSIYQRKSSVLSSENPNVLLFLEVFREFMEYMLELMGFFQLRVGPTVACLEALVIETMMTKQAAKTEKFLRVVSCQEIEGCIWASVQKDFLALAHSNSYDGRLRDYRSTVLNLKRNLVSYEYSNDTRGRRPDVSSNSATWESSCGVDLSGYLEDFIIARLVKLIKEKPILFAAHPDIFSREIEMAIQHLESEESESPPEPQ